MTFRLALALLLNGTHWLIESAESHIVTRVWWSHTPKWAWLWQHVKKQPFRIDLSRPAKKAYSTISNLFGCGSKAIRMVPVACADSYLTWLWTRLLPSEHSRISVIRGCAHFCNYIISVVYLDPSLKNIPFRLWSCTRDRSHSWQHKFRIDGPWVSCFEITKSGIRTGSCRHFISTECKPTPRPPADYKHWLYGT